MIHHTLTSDIDVLSWEVVDDDWECSSPALIDRAHVLTSGDPYLARIDYTQGLAWPESIGAQLADFEQLMFLREAAPFQLKPFLGTPRAENEIEHSRLHDEDAWRQLREMKWRPGAGPVYGAGKNWRRKRAGVMPPADKSALVGWDKDGGGPGVALWQPDAIAHNRFHFDDGTTTIVFRRRRRIVGVGESVVGAGSVIAAGAREIAAALFSHGGGPVAPPSPPSQGGHPLPLQPPKKDTAMPRSTIRKGSTGPLVSIWQAHLGLSVTGTFAGVTETATKDWQKANGLVPDGIVGDRSWQKYDEQQAALVAPVTAAPLAGLDAIPLVLAKNFKVVNRPASSVWWLIVHSMESAEKPDTAEAVANWFASAGAPMASAHYCIDSNSIVQCVPLKDIAFAAPGANERGVHFEFAGRAAQSEAEWNDAYSSAMIERGGRLMGEIAKLYDIPLEYIGVEGLKAGRKGVATHFDVSKAFKRSDHQDPGRFFNMDRLLEIARSV